MTLKPTNANADSATTVMDAIDAMPTRGLKKVVKRLADPSQSGTKWSPVLKDYINAVRWGFFLPIELLLFDVFPLVDR